MDQSIERWRPVVGYEGFYEVSDHGRVRSVDRQVWVEEPTRSYWRRYRQRVLAPSINRGGYAVVGLAAKGERITKTIHGLVLRAFVGPCPDENFGGPPQGRLSIKQPSFHRAGRPEALTTAIA